MDNFVTISALVLIVVVSGISSGKQDTSINIQQFLENLVKNDTNAYIIWNLTKQYNIGIPDIQCREELEQDPATVPFHIVNITLENFETKFYEMAMFYMYYEASSLKYGRIMYQNRSEEAVNMELYLTTAKHILEKGKENKKHGVVCGTTSDTRCGCISDNSLTEIETTIKNYRQYNKYLKEFVMFGTYLDPTVRILIMIVGLILNGVLVFIFINEKSIRTESNVMIFNLVVNNILMLLVYLPTNYITMYHIEDPSQTNVYTSVQMFVITVNVMVILLLNIQRYFDISRILDSNSRLSSTHSAIVCTVVTWGFGAAVGAAFLPAEPLTAMLIKILMYFLVYLFIFSVVLVIFNSMSARKLQHYAQQGQNSAEFQNVAGSGVIMHLTIIYYVTHTLYFIQTLFEEDAFHSPGGGYFGPTAVRIVVFVLHVIFFSYPCFNVLVLYKCSGTYRSFLKFYLFRCWYNPEEGQYVTMNSGDNLDAQRLCDREIA